MEGGRRTNGPKANSQVAGARAAKAEMAKPVNLEMNTTTTRKAGKPSGLDSLASLASLAKLEVNLARVKEKEAKLAKVEAVAEVADVATEVTEEVGVDLPDQDLEKIDPSLLSLKPHTERM